MSYLTVINRPEAENLSGCRNLRIARISDIDFFPRIIAGRVNGEIVLKTGASWIRWVPIENTFSFDSKTTESMEGVLQDNNIRFILPAININEHMLNQLQFDRVVVMVEDMNAITWVFGTPQRPMQFRYNRSTGTLGSGRAQYEGFFLGRRLSPRARYDFKTYIFTWDFLMDVDGIIMQDTEGNQMLEFS